MGYHSVTKYYKTLRFDWLCNEPPKWNVKCAGSRYLALSDDSCNARSQVV